MRALLRERRADDTAASKLRAKSFLEKAVTWINQQVEQPNRSLTSEEAKNIVGTNPRVVRIVQRFAKRQSDLETQGQMTKRARKAASDPRDPATQEGRAWWEDKPAWLQPK